MQIKFFVLLVIFAISLSACTTVSKDKGQPVPELTFEHVDSLNLNVAVIDIENNYDPANDPKDASSSFPTPPDIAVRRYAENRFRPVGADGRFKFIIEKSTVHHKYIAPEGNFAKWVGMGGEDHYDLFLKLRLYKEEMDGMQSIHSVLTFEKPLIIPDSLSLAERELAQLEFLEGFMNELDQAVMYSITNTLHLGTVQEMQGYVP